MREQWACPDLGLEKEPGIYLPVPGTLQEFPECPAAYLRTGPDVNEMTARVGRPAFGGHLIEGSINPANMVGAAAFELKNGARLAESLSPKMHALVHLWLHEEQSRDREADKRRKERR